MFFSVVSVNAASFGMSASTKEVFSNGTFTISVGGDCIGRVNLTVSNGTLSSKSVWIEQDYVNVTVTAGTSGEVMVTATPEVGFSDADANLYNPGSRSVSVRIVSNTTSEKVPNDSVKPPTSKPTTTTTSKKSGNNHLASLTVDLGELSPKFDTNVTDYVLQLPASTTEFIITASAIDGKATVHGIGKVKVKSGSNILKVEVIAENGSKKIYTINASVKEEPVVYLRYKNENIGLFYEHTEITLPQDFVSSEYAFDNATILLFTKGNIQLVKGVNEENEKSFYLFNQNTNALENKVTFLNVNHKDFLLLDVKSKRENVYLDKMVIEESEIDCYKFNSNEDHYCLFYALNENGEKVEYLYEKTENTIQLYPDFSLCSACTANNTNRIIYLFIGVLLLVVGTILFLIVQKKGGNKHEKVH